MMKVLTLLKARWRVLVFGAAFIFVATAAASLAHTLRAQKAQIDSLRGSLSTAKLEIGRQSARADRNAAEAGRYREAVDAMGALAKAQAQERAELNTLRNDVLRMIADAKPEDDAPMAPVLARTVDSLRDGAEAQAGAGS